MWDSHFNHVTSVCSVFGALSRTAQLSCSVQSQGRFLDVCSHLMSDGVAGLEQDWDWIEAIEGAQPRTRLKLRAAMRSLVHGNMTTKQIAQAAGVEQTTIRSWRRRYPPFDEAMRSNIVIQVTTRDELATNMRLHRLDQKDLVLPWTPTFPEEKPDLVDFSRIYLGRPSQPHHVALSRAWADQTNTKVMALLPTGAGKDTKANDAILLDICDDRGLLRTAFILENESFAMRRLARLTRYLTDQTLYTMAPGDTQGGTIPERSLIEDYGPFLWQKGMVWPDGTEVSRPKWNAHQADFVGSPINEADPQLWATGMGGDLYGTRLRRVVLSDVFTQKNQANPQIRHSQMAWLHSTFESRLDGRGRVLFLATMILEENNIEVLHDEWAGAAGVVYADEYYTKYRNGFAVVRSPAILDEGTERERSYWEDRFPYRTQIVQYDLAGLVIKQVDAHTLTDEEYVEKGEEGWEVVEGLVEQRGAHGTEKWKHFQATHQQTRVTDGQQVEFTDLILDMADDSDRSWGMVRDHEICIQGVDPASKYGAAVSVLAVDRQAQTITPVYNFWDTNLGQAGIKAKLILGPATMFMPLWLCYEINKHEGALEDSAVQAALKSLGVNISPHQTNAFNRNSLEIGPAGLVELMRDGTWRWPMRTAADREQTRLVKEHYKAWDRHVGENQRTTGPGRAGHQPDDRCMADWVASVQAREVLQAGTRHRPRIRQVVPPSVLRRLERYAQGYSASKRVNEADQIWHDGQGLDQLISIVVGEDPKGEH
jgi:DNA-binding transcriptional ArsR family regulator